MRRELYRMQTNRYCCVVVFSWCVWSVLHGCLSSRSVHLYVLVRGGVWVILTCCLWRGSCRMLIKLLNSVIVVGVCICAMAHVLSRRISLLVGGGYFCRRQQAAQLLYLPHTLHRDSRDVHRSCIYPQLGQGRDCSMFV